MSERKSLRLRLVALCFLMLFVELALIRWLGGNVLYLSYFSNIVLLGSFLGIGLGFLYTHKSSRDLLKFTPLALASLVAVVHFVPIKLRSDGGNVIFFGAEYKPSGPPRELALPIVFLVVALVLMCIGSGVASVFKQLKNLDAYQLDLIGSLIGIVAFTALSFIGTPPVVWGGVVALTLLWAVWPKALRDLALMLIPIAVMMVTLGIESANKNNVWTPYYKVKYKVDSSEGAMVYVNGIGHWGQTASYDYPMYQAAYNHRTSTEPVTDLLVIGAGSGNDVAVGLHNNVEHVDAVEIDSRLLEIAKKYHPNKPYDDPRVDTHTDDGRAFIERSNKQWNMIVLALTDSLTLVQGASSIRLESYLFTVDAAKSYRDHLDEGGVFAMYNFYREPWLVDRYASTLEEAFGHAPCVTRIGGNMTVLTVGFNEDNVACKPEELWTRTSEMPDPVSDDRPFPYLKNPTIPTFYLVSLTLVLLVSLLLIRGVGGPMKGMREYADLFFMGVAFLLLETKNVVQFALLFGTTWLVNALVFASVLLSVLLAVTISKRIKRLNLKFLYVLLGITILIGWLVPAHSLLSLSFAPRLLLASAIAFAPIFVANMIFAQRFRETGDSAPAFAANLFGAILGGVLEYSSLLLGYRNLLIIAFVLYGCALIAGRKHLNAAAA